MSLKSSNQRPWLVWKPILQLPEEWEVWPCNPSLKEHNEEIFADTGGVEQCHVMQHVTMPVANGCEVKNHASLGASGLSFQHTCGFLKK